jgi:2-polyprenyl-3-methyl-5-hydroxy-6-metoxy-1,4-benzoquinol methylase
MDNIKCPVCDSENVVFLSQVLEHIITPNAFLIKVRELLLNGGILHIDVPNHNSISSLLRKVNPFQKDYGFIQPNHHLIAYTEKSLSHLLKQNQFKIRQLRAYENNHDTFGQLIVRTGIINNLLFFISRVTKRGSLLVAIATKE